MNGKDYLNTIYQKDCLVFLGHPTDGVGYLDVDFLRVGCLFDADFLVWSSDLYGVRKDVVPYDFQHATFG